MSEFEARMAELRERFRSRSADRARDLQAAVATRDVAQLIRVAHEIAGNAGIFGYHSLSACAQRLESAASESGDAPRTMEAAENLLRELEKVSGSSA